MNTIVFPSILLIILVGITYGSPFVEECVSGKYPPKGRPVIPSHVVNLDLPPQQRWNEVLKDKGPQIVNLLKYFRTFISSMGSGAETLMNLLLEEGETLTKTMPAPFGQEIEGIAAVTKIPVGEVLLYNIFYEIFTVCTSIVGMDSNGVMYHARNLDFGLFMGWNVSKHVWAVSSLLRPMVVNVDFQKGGKTIFQTVNFAGYIGALTGIKPGVFTMTMNERFNIDGGYIGILEWFVLGERNIHWMSFLTRNTLEYANSFAEAKSMLAKTPMLAPAYFILGGNQTGQGSVITRSREKAVDIWDLDAKKGVWYLLETNYDHWQKPFVLDDRRTPGNKCMKQKTQKSMSIPMLFDVLSSRPVLNMLTTYAALMQVNKGHLESHLQYCPKPCSPW